MPENLAHYAATYAFRTNSTHRCCCKPTAHYDNSRDPINVLEKPRSLRKLRPALQHLTA